MQRILSAAWTATVPPTLDRFWFDHGPRSVQLFQREDGQIEAHAVPWYPRGLPGEVAKGPGAATQGEALAALEAVSQAESKRIHAHLLKP